MMRQIPSTVVIAVLALIFASWPGVQAWGEVDVLHHYLVHGLYVLAGALCGLQTAWWVHRPVPVSRFDEGGVSS